MRPAYRYALAALSGALYFLGFIGFGIWPLIFFCFVPLLLAMEGQSVKRAAKLGGLAGAVAGLGGFYWVIIVVVQFGKLPTAVGVLGWFLVAAVQGGRLALTTAIAQGLRRQLAPEWGFCLALVAMEYSYPLLFPSSIGDALYAQVYLTQIADVAGIWGLSLLIGLVNVGLYAALSRRAWAPAAAAAVVVALTLSYGAWRVARVDAASAAAPKLKVGLVQVNLGATEKDSEVAAFILKHQELSRRLAAAHPELDLIVWPETGYNDWIQKDRRYLRKVAPGVQIPVLFGALGYRLRPGEDKTRASSYDMFNTAFLMDSAGKKLGDFDKMRPLMFGETLPWAESLKGLYKWLLPGFAALKPGESHAPLVLPSKARMLPMICYEDILPDLVRELWTEGGPAELLVNITNDSWYGDTHEPLIHLGMATFRSVETHRAMVRATNTGVSALIDPAGRVVKRSGQWEEALLVGEVPVIKGGDSTLYMRFGDWLPILCWVLILALAAREISRRRAAKAAA